MPSVDGLRRTIIQRGGEIRTAISGLALGASYARDGLVTKHNSDFVRDERFARSYAHAKQRTHHWTDIQWRAYVACWLGEQAKSLEGDYVECGVYRGFLSLAVMEYIGFKTMTGRTFWLLDTYEGIASSLVTEEERRSGATRALCASDAYADVYPEVSETFREYPNVRIIKGIVPGTLERVTSTRVAYVSLDMNNAAPEIAAAEYLWDRLVPGGAILLDDYGWRAHVVQKRAFDRFASEHSVSVLSLPTGQGLMVKPGPRA